MALSAGDKLHFPGEVYGGLIWGGNWRILCLGEEAGLGKAVFGDSLIFNWFSIFGEEMNKLHK